MVCTAAEMWEKKFIKKKNSSVIFGCKWNFNVMMLNDDHIYTEPSIETETVLWCGNAKRKKIQVKRQWNVDTMPKIY